MHPMLYCCWCPDVKHQDIGGKKKKEKKILIQLSLFYIDAAQNKTKQNKVKELKKKKKKKNQYFRPLKC